MDRPDGVVVPEAEAATAVVDTDGVVRAWSGGAERLLGHPAGDVIGRSAAQLLAHDAADAARRCRDERAGWHGWLGLRHRDGHVVPVRVVAAPAADADGALSWSVTVSLWQRAAEHIGLLEWAFEQSSNSLSIYDSDGRIQWTNAMSLRRMGIRREETTGRTLDELFRPDASGATPARPAVMPPDERAADSMRGVVETAREVAREGKYQRVELVAATSETRLSTTWAVDLSPIRDPAGEVRGVFAAASNISDQVRARRRLALLKEAGDRLGSTLDVTRTAQELADIMVPELADFATVDLLPEITTGGEPPAPSPDGLTLRRVAQQSVHEGAPESVVPVGATDRYPADSTTARCLATGRAVMASEGDPVYERWAAEDERRQAVNEAFGIHSAMAVPLRARGTVLGTALFLRSRSERFARDDLLLAEELCARAAVSVDNARRFARERGTALALQRSLLPQKLQGHSAVQVASRYLPAGSRAGVGGDWFDVVPLSGTRVALVIGDVVGHGLHASATMGRLRTAVRTLADVDLPPDELLTHLDDLVSHLAEQAGALDPAPSTVSEIGATCLYAVYDPVSRSCTVASAGHPPPVIVGPDGSTVPLHVTPGPPLGVGGLPFESATTELPEGSLIALTTNGLIAPRDREFDSGQRTLQEVLARPADSLETVCDAVIHSLLPERQTDDAALLVARTRALDAQHVATIDLAADPSVVARARKMAADQLVAWELPEAAFITELVVSELVTNAIRHAAPPIQLRLIRGESSLICEVSDSSSTAPHLRRARTFDEGGRGLLLVAQLTQQWGTRQTATGKTIWAEQHLTET
ncbi:ATP-binding SpoIIE family protein phosphatase [Streptomyces avicenniae]|uniref:ATP-binding SpoIIE family protein phosphatase n=1 Tax=Streptomyces avicenniae TaxID=500153 RepID=UPI000699C996|nr:SpoIIE family protein phosphatase [Streptomyces avicenniae]